MTDDPRAVLAALIDACMNNHYVVKNGYGETIETQYILSTDDIAPALLLLDRQASA